MESERSLSIGQVAEEVGLRPSAIRFYEQVGLLPEPERVGGRRRYREDVIGRLNLIRFLKDVHFKLDEIKGLVEAPGAPPGHKGRWRALAARKLSEVAMAIEDLQTVESLLEEGISCDCLEPESCDLLLRRRADSAGR